MVLEISLPTPTPLFENLLKDLFRRSTVLRRKNAARLLGMSESKFARNFPKYFHMTFQKARSLFPFIAASLRLLDDPAAKISKIAASLEYFDVTAFGRLFRERWGISPRAFRRKFHRLSGQYSIAIHTSHARTVRLEVLSDPLEVEQLHQCPGILVISSRARVPARQITLLAAPAIAVAWG